MDVRGDAPRVVQGIAVAQIIYGSRGFGAHPTSYIGTIVIDTRSADPIMYQFGPRLPAVVTVRWTAPTDMLAPVMSDIAK